MNVVILTGRLTKDPEVRYTQSMMAVAGISIAVDRRYKGQDETDFFNCTAFGKTAEVLEKHFHKGQKILIEGSLQNETYTNREGRKVTVTKIIINRLDFMDSKPKDEPRDEPDATRDGFMNIPDDVADDELPFN